MDPPFIQMCGVSKRYGASEAVLRNINLEVSKGEFVAIIGPSGCGKSTILKMLSSLSPVTEGKITIGGRDPVAAKNQMAFIFQDSTLLPWRTVTRNISLPMEIRGIKKTAALKKTAGFLEMVGLGRVGDHYPRQLSGGMKMRASIARALVLAPQILLLDEPFGALDEITRDRLNEELLDLRDKEPFTAFFVTHSVAEAVFLSSRILILKSHPGRIHQEVVVPFGYPRVNGLRETAEYTALVSSISRALREVTPAP